MPTPKELVLAYVDAFNNRDLDGLCSLFAPDAQIWGVSGFATPDKARFIWQQLMSSLRINLQIDSIVEDGNTVAVRYTERGRSLAPFLGHEPTGKSYELLAMEFFEIDGGQIQRRWGARDSASQNRQLGFS